MKLAEALILRADCQKRVAQLRQRLSRSAKVQEGERPPENPQELLAELDSTLTDLTTLIKQINKTNALTPLEAGSLSDALAEREMLLLRRNALSQLTAEAAIRQERYSRSEVRFVSTVEIADIQQQIDTCSRRYRELDSQVQALNWQVDLVEI